MTRTSTFKFLILTLISITIPGLSLTAQEGEFRLPTLPYAYNALEPAIDAMTMEIHYTKHHATYVKNLNLAVKADDAGDYTLEELNLWAGEFSDALRNNAGGHYNHTLFWNILGKGHPFNPANEVGKAILATFGSVDSLYMLLSKAGASRFGSGWAWLYITPEKTLAVASTPNQDNPLMDVSANRGIPILGIDVWEHAYYLKYQNKRGDYLSAVLSVLNWDAINNNYKEALKSDLLRTLERETWKELSAFHEVMSQTFHPSEDGNLDPIRQRSTEMVERAAALQMSTIPASFRTPEIKKALSNLVTGSEELDLLIKKRGSDKEVTAKLSSLHDTFHIIQGLCRH